MTLALRLGFAAAMLLVAGSARADFFDDVKRTFQTDIPHFFQDDIPCAFGGQPTSGARRACKGAERPAQPAAERRASPPPRPRPAEAQAKPEAPAKPEVETRTPREYP